MTDAELRERTLELCTELLSALQQSLIYGDSERVKGYAEAFESATSALWNLSGDSEVD